MVSKSLNDSRRRYFDNKKVQCFDCDKYGHIAFECWFNKDNKSKNDEQKENVAHKDSNLDSDPIMLMATTNDEESEPSSDIWYLEIGSSNHMTGKKDWPSEFDDSKKTNVRRYV